MYNNLYVAGQSKIVSSAYGDVNGDGINDYVFLTAMIPAESSSPYLENIKLNVQDGTTDIIYTISLDKEGSAGYEPTVYLGDFTGDGIKDILIAIDSGGSGALTFNYVYSFLHNQAEKLFDYSRYNEKNQYVISYLDYYKAKVYSSVTEKTYLITLSDRSEDYLSQIYDESGRLKKTVQGMADGVSGFYPVDMNRDGVYEIQAYQQISGLYHADAFGYIINTLKWNGEQFVIWQQWFAIIGDK